MWATLLSLYAGIAVLSTGLAARYALRSQSRPREHLDRADRALLLATSTLAGALWIALLVLFLRGWRRERWPKLRAAARRRWTSLRGGSTRPALAPAAPGEPIRALLPPGPDLG